jgi:ketosteroid isomerase-like protein
MLTSETTHSLRQLDKDVIAALIRNFWRTRLEDSAEALRRYASPDVTFSVLSGGQKGSTWRIFEGIGAAAEAVRYIDMNLEFLSFEIIDLIVESDRVGLRWHAVLRNRGTGVVGELAVFDLITVSDGLIVDYAEFLDTDGFNRLMSGEAQPGTARRANMEKAAPLITDLAAAQSPDDDRDETDRRIRAFYADRRRLGSAAIAKHCAADCELRIIGDPVLIPFARRHSGIEEVAALIAGIDMEFEMLNQDIVELLVDGDRAAVRWLSTSRHRGTGAWVSVEALDHLILRHGKIASVTEFFDTAAIAGSIAG